jgi:hypothetical protein
MRSTACSARSGLPSPRAIAAEHRRIGDAGEGHRGPMAGSAALRAMSRRTRSRRACEGSAAHGLVRRRRRYRREAPLVGEARERRLAVGERRIGARQGRAQLPGALGGEDSAALVRLGPCQLVEARRASSRRFMAIRRTCAFGVARRDRGERGLIAVAISRTAAARTSGRRASSGASIGRGVHRAGFQCVYYAAARLPSARHEPPGKSLSPGCGKVGRVAPHVPCGVGGPLPLLAERERARRRSSCTGSGTLRWRRARRASRPT